MNRKAFLVALLAATSLVSTVALAQNGSTDLKPKAPVSKPRLSDIPTVDTEVSEQKQADVNYLTGGIGDDERQLIQASKATYNTHITNASTDGAFVGDTEIVITGKEGAEILRVDAGPLLYVQLPAGKYTLTATHGEEKKTETITIGAKKKATANVVLRWKL